MNEYEYTNEYYDYLEQMNARRDAIADRVFSVPHHEPATADKIAEECMRSGSVSVIRGDVSAAIWSIWVKTRADKKLAAIESRPRADVIDLRPVSNIALTRVNMITFEPCLHDIRFIHTIHETPYDRPRFFRGISTDATTAENELNEIGIESVNAADAQNVYAVNVILCRESDLATACRAAAGVMTNPYLNDAAFIIAIY